MAKDKVVLTFTPRTEKEIAKRRLASKKKAKVIAEAKAKEEKPKPKKRNPLVSLAKAVIKKVVKPKPKPKPIDPKTKKPVVKKVTPKKKIENKKPIPKKKPVPKKEVVKKPIKMTFTKLEPVKIVKPRNPHKKATKTIAKKRAVKNKLGKSNA